MALSQDRPAGEDSGRSAIRAKTTSNAGVAEINAATVQIVRRPIVPIRDLISTLPLRPGPLSGAGR